MERDDFWLRLHEMAGTLSDESLELMLEVLSCDFSRLDPVTQQHLAIELETAVIGLSKLLEIVRLLPTESQKID